MTNGDHEGREGSKSPITRKEKKPALHKSNYTVCNQKRSFSPAYRYYQQSYHQILSQDKIWQPLGKYLRKDHLQASCIWYQETESFIL